MLTLSTGWACFNVKCTEAVVVAWTLIVDHKEYLHKCTAIGVRPTPRLMCSMSTIFNVKVYENFEHNTIKLPAHI